MSDRQVREAAVMDRLCTERQASLAIAMEAARRLLAAADHSHQMDRITAALCSEAESMRAALVALDAGGSDA